MSSTTKLNGVRLGRMMIAGANELASNKQLVDAMNVFPVPDGDTGTNMSLTVMAAAREAEKNGSLQVADIAKAASGGALRGARGNSGVITSQIFMEEAGVQELAAAAEQAVKTAYKAVMKPKEGTILTVARGCAEAAVRLAEETDEIEVFLKGIIEDGHKVLAQTPEMLPVLKQAGVVDAGGRGLLYILEGALKQLGSDLPVTLQDGQSTAAAPETNFASLASVENESITFGYCTEFFINVDHPDEAVTTGLKAYLGTIGDSIVCVADDDVVKIHVHTNDPGLAIQKALTYGQLSKMKIDNMREEHQEKLIRDAEKLAEEQAKEEAAYEEKKTAEPRKAMGFITVSIGAGMNEIFKELGADYIIESGQTMNPSTEDMLNAIDQVNADTVFILPNNKNIILAANQAKSLVEDKEIIVIPTKTVPQGITAIINFMPDADVKTNEEAMLEEIKNVKTGQMTYAVRDTHIDDKEIHEGDIMGIGDSGILAVGKDLEETTKELIANLVDEDSELISIYYGEEVSEEEAEKFAGEIEELYPDVDVDIQFGGQPIYYYVLAVE